MTSGTDHPRLRLADVLGLTPTPESLERLPPRARFCRAAYCTYLAGHAGRHDALHSLMLDEHHQQNPPWAMCSCHPAGGADDDDG